MKNSSVSVTKTIAADAESVWQSIAMIRNIENWLEPLADSEVTGEGVGAKRVCNMADGSGKIYETIETIDYERKVFQYSIQELPMPIKNVYGTMQVKDLGSGQTEVTWSVDFQVDEENETFMKDTITGFYVMGIQGLEKLHPSAA